LIVVLLVALLALTGAALLDLVSVDLSLSAEHSKIVRAQMISDGALREVLADIDSGAQFPDFDAAGGCNGGPPVPGAPACPQPNYRYNWAGDVGGVIRKNPDGINSASVPLNEANSVYAKYTTSPNSEENYSATVDLLRIVPLFDSSLTVTRAVVYEVNTTGVVAGSRSSRETSAEIYQITTAPPGPLPPRLHHR
jgi:hypothetical protein